MYGLEGGAPSINGQRVPLSQPPKSQHTVRVPTSVNGSDGLDSLRRVLHEPAVLTLLDLSTTKAGQGQEQFLQGAELYGLASAKSPQSDWKYVRRAPINAPDVCKCTAGWSELETGTLTSQIDSAVRGWCRVWKARGVFMARTHQSVQLDAIFCCAPLLSSRTITG